MENTELKETLNVIVAELKNITAELKDLKTNMQYFLRGQNRQ